MLVNGLLGDFVHIFQISHYSLSQHGANLGYTVISSVTSYQCNKKWYSTLFFFTFHFKIQIYFVKLLFSKKGTSKCWFLIKLSASLIFAMVLGPLLLKLVVVPRSRQSVLSQNVGQQLSLPLRVMEFKYIQEHKKLYNTCMDIVGVEKAFLQIHSASSSSSSSSAGFTGIVRNWRPQSQTIIFQ